MQIIDNINTTVKGDLQSVIHKKSKLSIAAACFSIYAYQEMNKFEVKLRNELTQKAIAKECADWIRQKVTFKFFALYNRLPVLPPMLQKTWAKIFPSELELFRRYCDG